MKKKQKHTHPELGKEILVNVILDRSGSMESNRDGTISGYNEYLKGLRADKETRYHLSLTQFDMPVNTPELTVSYVDKPLEQIENLTRQDYEPRGTTPLYDAIGECLRRTSDKSSGRPVMTVIITDGLENASQEFTQQSVKDLIKQKEALGWSFVFLGANIDSYAASANVGLGAHTTSNYVNDPVHARAAFTATAGSAMRYASAVRARTYHKGMDLIGAQARASMGDKRPSRGTAPRFPVAPRARRPWTTTDVSHA